ncbi:MAG: porin [Rhodocyclaceae bacterium]|nr:porin [Rhodocyclaceae bacterium]
MQKKLIALAIAGLASTAAFAAENVTVYGVADATYDFISVSGGSTANNNISLNRVSTNSSLIGFKGSESLGNGLTAVFQFESAAAFDGAGALGLTRDSFVGLAGGFGTVVAGNLTGPTRAFGAAVDVNAGATGVGANIALIGKMGNVLTGTLNTATVGAATATSQVNGVTAGTRSTTYASAYDNRFANAIAYISPTFNGFTAIIGYVPNEGKVGGTTVAGSAASYVDPSAWDLGLKYANGPVLVGLSHADVKLRNSADTHTQDTRLVASYDFGQGTVRGLWDKSQADLVGGVNASQTVWGLGGTLNTSADGKLIAQYYKANNVSGSAALGAADNTGARFYELGYEHNLSKRTMLKAVYARLANDTSAAYEFGVNGTGLSSAGAALTGVQLGLRHTF